MLDVTLVSSLGVFSQNTRSYRHQRRRLMLLWAVRVMLASRSRWTGEHAAQIHQTRTPP